ncbi:diacylglycerol kinase [Deinococcus depolymerans]|uniref:Diacylglycerol kinase n=1 Tax=Deinococcus depolymerans TaxID=392408 RepID=A0ABP3MH45_9DEIO
MSTPEPGAARRPSARSPRRWWRSARFAWTGVTRTYRTQANFRLECWAALGALGLTVWLRAPVAPVALACALVLSLELLNTALEAVVDLVSPEWHALAGVAKDAAAAAVLLGSAGALIVGLSVLLPPLLTRLGLT